MNQLQAAGASHTVSRYFVRRNCSSQERSRPLDVHSMNVTMRGAWKTSLPSACETSSQKSLAFGIYTLIIAGRTGDTIVQVPIEYVDGAAFAPVTEPPRRSTAANGKTFRHAPELRVRKINPPRRQQMNERRRKNATLQQPGNEAAGWTSLSR